MKDPIEEFITGNRELFDADPPGRNLFAHIHKKYSRKKNKVFGMLTLRQLAASLILIVGAATIMIVINYNKIHHALQAEEVKYISSSYQEELAVISRNVEFKQTQLKQIEKTEPELYKSFKQLLEEQNLYYILLENALSSTPNKEIILKAMIQNLQMQQELLTRQLSIFQNLQKEKNEKPVTKI